MVVRGSGASSLFAEGGAIFFGGFLPVKFCSYRGVHMNWVKGRAVLLRKLSRQERMNPRDVVNVVSRNGVNGTSHPAVSGFLRVEQITNQEKFLALLRENRGVLCVYRSRYAARCGDFRNHSRIPFEATSDLELSAA